jgi:hypothetical protein
MNLSLSSLDTSLETSRLQQILQNFRHLGNFGIPSFNNVESLLSNPLYDDEDPEDDTNTEEGAVCSYVTTTKTYASTHSNGQPLYIQKTKTTRKGPGGVRHLINNKIVLEIIVEIVLEILSQLIRRLFQELR